MTRVSSGACNRLLSLLIRTETSVAFLFEAIGLGQFYRLSHVFLNCSKFREYSIPGTKSVCHTERGEVSPMNLCLVGTNSRGFFVHGAKAPPTQNDIVTPSKFTLIYGIIAKDVNMICLFSRQKFW